MTEADWLACTDPRRMVECLAGRPMQELIAGSVSDEVSGRKLRLFALAWYRFITSLITSVDPDLITSADRERRLRAIETEERYVDGEATSDEVSAARAAVFGAQTSQASPWDDALEIVHETGWDVGWSPDQDERCDRTRACFLRDIFGNPFRPTSVNKSWLRWNDGTVPKLAQSIYDTRDFSLMPILADALEDAGCDHADILNHCRQPGEHVRGCWVIDLLLGKS